MTHAVSHGLTGPIHTGYACTCGLMVLGPSDSAAMEAIAAHVVFEEEHALKLTTKSA